MTVEEIKLLSYTAGGTPIWLKAEVEYHDGRIYFLKSPFKMKDEIKAMQGSKWHGFEKDKPKPSPNAANNKVWSIADCQRNRFQLSYLQNQNPYEWFERPLTNYSYSRPLMAHQCDLADAGLTYHFQIWAAEMGTGKTLAAIEVMEKSGVKEWFFCAPKAVLKAIEREFKKWNLDPSIKVHLHTYEALTRIVDEWPKDKPPPGGVIFDESSRLKTATSQRTKAAQKLADMIRFHWDHKGYVILMSGTPSPKSPLDWWAQAEIAYPGFLKEGSPKALESRLAFMVEEQYDAGPFKRREGWRDNELKCNTCGQFREEGPHAFDGVCDPDDIHDYVASENEVALMHERLAGLVVVKHKKDCLTLPDKRYRTVYCKPNKSTLRAVQALMSSAPNTITGLSLARELSDGFQYREQECGMKTCGHCKGETTVQEWFDPEDEEATYSAVDMLSEELVARLEKRTIECPLCYGKGEVKTYERIEKRVPCPKEPALVELLEECEENGRILVFAGFTGSVNRVQDICLKNKWDVVRLDGRGFQVTKCNSDDTTEVLHGEDALEYWANRANAKVAFVAHPESGGMGLTLVEARMAVFWSNSFKPEYRIQSEDRIHRPGMDLNLGCEIVDLIHLPTDQRVVDVIRENRKLELMTLGEFTTGLSYDSPEAIDDTPAVAA